MTVKEIKEKVPQKTLDVLFNYYKTLGWDKEKTINYISYLTESGAIFDLQKIGNLEE